MTGAQRRELSVEDYVSGVTDRDRAILARAITLIESANPRHKQLAREVLARLMPETGRATRVGITGVPGVGKSTFIDAFGTHLTSQGHAVAVLAVDPSSGVSGGSILGDKTRMTRLAADDLAFIRPSPSAGTLGGVASKTRETLLLCEAAGFDVVLVETMGVGQSETIVAEMTDFFLALMLPGAGDELQGIKRGLLELADLVAVNKADGENLARASMAVQHYAAALRYARPRDAAWVPPVMTCSALENSGLVEIWSAICRHRELLAGSGRLDALRRDQLSKWMWALVDDELKAAFKREPAVSEILDAVEREVRDGKLPPSLGARRVLAAFGIADQEPAD